MGYFISIVFFILLGLKFTLSMPDLNTTSDLVTNSTSIDRTTVEVVDETTTTDTTAFLSTTMTTTTTSLEQTTTTIAKWTTTTTKRNDRNESTSLKQPVRYQVKSISSSSNRLSSQLFYLFILIVLVV